MERFIIYLSLFSISVLIFLMQSSVDTADGNPVINNAKLKVEIYHEGLHFPTQMAFIGDNDLLLLNKDNGTVHRITNGKISEKPLLDLHVANEYERGLLGIAVDRESNPIRVFLYFTESGSGKDGDDHRYFLENGSKQYFLYDPTGKRLYKEVDEDGNPLFHGTDPLGNRVYRYELIDNKLVNGKLILDLPAVPNRHHGGPLVIGPDRNLYLFSGDRDHRTKAQNFEKGPEADGTSGILRFDQDGNSTEPHIFGDTYPNALYYAYGLRNSFGMDFDPVTGNLWATEAGLYTIDEINRIEPGMNGGWADIQGFVDRCSDKLCPRLEDKENPLRDLALLNGRGNYSDPEIAWDFNITPTALKFLNTEKLGKDLQNDILVGDFNNGNLYHFELTEDRNSLLLKNTLQDKIVNAPDEIKDILFGEGFGGQTSLGIKKHKEFGGITDIEIGPDGNVYILTFRATEGTIYKISPILNQ